MAQTQRKPRRIALLLLVNLLAAVLFLEVGSRVFWKVRYGVPLGGEDALIYAFYPELRGPRQADIKAGDRPLDVLMLGGSVLHPQWGCIGQTLHEQLAYQTRRPVRIHNLARPAHTSLDSRIKYRYLSDIPFDIVLVYHGINEVRANNCPPAVFRDDYSHYSWYRTLHFYERHKQWIRWLQFPYTVVGVWHKARERLGAADVLPRHNPREDWLDHGSTIATAEPFRRNLQAIIELAAAKGEREPVMLMTFAHHMPEDYSLEKFDKRELDYTTHLAAIELWGRPRNVVAGIEAHNAFAATLGKRYDHVLTVDQHRLIPAGGRWFNDICHLTTDGCRLFVENVMRELRRANVIEDG